MIEQVRNTVPLIHCITNYVTVGDVANMILAAGGSPIMADGIHEAEDITSICRGLVINIGTLNERTIESMLRAGKRAAELGHPIVFDPVGAGASAFRTETAMKIMEEIPCTVIRGNVSEIKTIAGELGLGKKIGNSAETNISRGVDSNELDVVTEENLEQMCRFAKELSRKTGAVVAITGAIDVVADCDHAYVIRNGHAMMAKVTGTGCMLDGVIAAYVCGGGKAVAEAVAEAIAAEGLCGELAYKKMLVHNGGTGSFRIYLFDFMSQLDDERLDGGKRIEIR